jgi:hypothetical protein
MISRGLDLGVLNLSILYVCQCAIRNISPIISSIFVSFHYKMGLGVLEDHKLEHVPGTVFLNEAGSVNLEAAVETGKGGQAAAGLKHDKNIVLVPQVLLPTYPSSCKADINLAVRVSR